MPMSEINTDNSFTIVIPTYNRASDLNRCLNSLVGQTYTNFEVIVCDDGSADDTKAVIAQYTDKLNLRYFYNENWGGPAKPRNLGIHKATGNWICFLDSDDWYASNRLACLAGMDKTGIDFIYHNLVIVSKGNNLKNMTSRQLKDNCFHDLLFNLNTIATSSTCIRKDLLLRAGGFREEKDIIGLEDFDLWIRMAKYGVTFKHVNQALGYYNLGNDNITFYDIRQINRFKAMYSYHINKLSTLWEKDKAAGAMNYQIARIYLMGKSYSDFLKHIRLALKKGSGLIKFKSIYQTLLFLKSKTTG